MCMCMYVCMYVKSSDFQFFKYNVQLSVKTKTQARLLCGIVILFQI
jgi:hypothetical protein